MSIMPLPIADLQKAARTVVAERDVLCLPVAQDRC
jgi:hypothetical protein